MHAPESQIYIALIIAVLILAFVISSFLYSMLKQQKKFRKLEREHADAQVQLLEKDRARIAADLHDDLSSMIGSVKTNLSAIIMQTQEHKSLLITTANDVDEINKRIRSISFDLMPSQLEDKGLLVSLRNFVDSVNATTGGFIKFSAPPDHPNLNYRQIIHIYRIVQEIIHNTVKHANASELMIVLKEEKGYLVLATRDNGSGFDFNHQLEKSKGLGLKSLMNRVSLLQAEFLLTARRIKGQLLPFESHFKMTKPYSRLRVVIADDHWMVRRGLQTLIGMTDVMEIVGEATNGEELVRITKELEPDVLLVDVKMPKCNGIEATKMIKQEFPHIGVVALSSYDDDYLILDMVEAGAKGYVLKNAGATEILSAVQAAYKDESYYCKDILVKLAQIVARGESRKEIKNIIAQFSRRDRLIIQMICDEFSSKQIAEVMNFSVRTVERYRDHIMEKMGVKNAAGLVKFAVRNGLYSPGEKK